MIVTHKFKPLTNPSFSPIILFRMTRAEKSNNVPILPIPTGADILTHLQEHPEITASTDPVNGPEVNLNAHIKAHSGQDTHLPLRLRSAGGSPIHGHQSPYTKQPAHPRPWLGPTPRPQNS